MVGRGRVAECLYEVDAGRERIGDIAPEPLHGAVDAERQLPDELRDRREALHGAACVQDVEQHADPREDDQRAADRVRTTSSLAVRGGTCTSGSRGSVRSPSRR